MKKVGPEVLILVFLAVVGGATAYVLTRDTTRPQLPDLPDSGSSDERLFDAWLANAPAVIRANAGRPSLDISAIISALILDTVKSYKLPARRVESPTTLGALAREWYGQAKYWQLLVAVNLDRLDGRTATSEAMVGPGVFFVLLSAKHERVYSEEDMWAKRQPDVVHLYETWLRLAEQDEPYSDALIMKLTRQAQDAELGFAYAPVETTGKETLMALGLQTYRDERFWKIVRWFNQVGWCGSKQRLDQTTAGDVPLRHGTCLMIPRVTPP